MSCKYQKKHGRFIILVLAVVIVAGLTFSCGEGSGKHELPGQPEQGQAAAEVRARTSEDQSKFTADEIINRFKEGNKRFADNKPTLKDLPCEIQANAKAQFPLAVILSCMDSRIPSELVFDESIGDLFVIRVAGNIVNEDVLGSMEYGCKVSGAKLIVVMGHEDCGAVKSAIKEVKMGNITSLLQKIKPAIDKSANYTGDKSYKNHDFIDMVSLNNVFVSINEIKARSPILKEMADKGEIRIVGAVYDMNTGIVKFLE